MKKLANPLSVKNLLKTLTFLFCLAAFISCEKSINEVVPDPAIINPLTDFEMIKDPNNAFKYTFRNLSSKYKRVEWRFGDDTLNTNIDVTHTYATTGQYNVELRTYSETGNTSRKLMKVDIFPDSVFEITQKKTNVPDQIELGLKVKGTIKSVLWTFNDVIPATTSTALNPLRTYVPGKFNTLSAKVTTVDGSVATVTRTNATSSGFVRDITQEREDYTVSAENTALVTENSVRILDNNVESKFVIGGKDGRLFTYPYIVTINYKTPQVVKIYAVGNSNDLPARDPKAWNVQGSNDGVNWEVLDTRLMAKNFYTQMTDLGATTDVQRYKQLFNYAIANPKSFTKYRWVITANWGEAAMQINDFRLYK